MCSDLKFRLEQAQSCINSALSELENAPTIENILVLIEACEAIDQRYKEHCEEGDEWDGYEKGTYRKEGGIGVEFYIDDVTWGPASLALEQLKKDLKNE